MNRLVYIALLWTLIAISCVREDMPSDGYSEDIQMVEVSLDLSLEKATAGTSETKSIDNPSDARSTKVRNLNILQFAGTDDNAKIVGKINYIPEITGSLSAEKLLLAHSQGELHTIVILANTFTQLPHVTTLGQLKNLFRLINNDYDVFGHEGDGKDFSNGTTEFYQRMNAIAVTAVESETSIKASLRRAMARINLHIENDGTDGLKIKTVQMMSVSRKDYYITDYSYIDSDNSFKDLFPEPFQDVYDTNDPKRMNYNAVDWLGNDDGTGSADYTFYIPANQRGIYSDNLLPQEKNRCPNVDGATYVEITGTYGPEETIVVYSFYLGGNLVNDFNIRPNTIYTYNLTFSGKGNSIVDDRIDDLAPINFDVDANCYILNPPPSHSRAYTFNAINRPNIFWGDRYGLQEKYPNYKIDEEVKWHARILWSDFEMTKEEANAFLSTAEDRCGKGDYMDPRQRIKITVPAGIQGNVVVGVYIEHPDNILWSWHLWITDYQPDNIEKHAPVDGKFIYPVVGGEVHRYNGLSWNDEKGEYKKGYAMDRCIGAIDALSHLDEKGGGLVYQFGRKDPFIETAYSIWTYDEYGNPTLISDTKNLKYVENTDAVLYGTNIPYSVNHPTLLIHGHVSWENNDINIEWNETHVSDKDDDDDWVEKNIRKSFFDPCPKGWRIPTVWYRYADHVYSQQERLSNCYQGFVSGPTDTTNPDVTTNGFNPYGKTGGRTYYPKGYLAEKENPNPQAIFFPCLSSRNYKGETRNDGWCWGITQYRKEEAFALRIDINRSNVLGTYFSGSWYLNAVRCVRENYQ